MERKRGRRDRTCVDCGLVESVRQDNTGVRCRSCAPKFAAVQRASGAGWSMCAPPVKKADPSRSMTLSCSGCSGLFTRFVSDVKNTERSYCSRECLSRSRSVDCSCEHCGKSFATQVGRLSDRTNSATRFCSRPCYWASLTKPDKAAPYSGGGWQRASAEAIRRAPFCGCCGRRRGRLEAHHILPRRLGGPDLQSNLIPLCPTCHKRVESSTRLLERLGTSPATLGWFMGQQLRWRQRLTFSLLKKISHERTHSAA